jgi:hypothetical protein
MKTAMYREQITAGQTLAGLVALVTMFVFTHPSLGGETSTHAPALVGEKHHHTTGV